MSLRPRYRPGATRRPFVDRIDSLEAFRDALGQVTAAPPGTPVPVLTFVGVGGIGKSRLLTEIASSVRDTRPYATLDLQVPSLAQQENALAALRAQFSTAGIDFPRFDIAYAVWWQRLHPNLRISREGLSLVEHSEVLTEILNSASGVPVFGASVRLVDWATRRARRWHWMRADETLRELDSLSVMELADAVNYLFATELAEGSRRKDSFVLLVDAYEALVGGAARIGDAAARDVWLRDLIGQFTDGVVVVASREPLRWDHHHPDWASRVRLEQVDDLPMESRLELLAGAGMAADGTRQAIAEASSGLPFYLHLAIDAGGGLDGRDGPDTTRLTSDPGVDAGGRSEAPVSTEAILERFCAHVAPDHVRLLELASVARLFDEAIFARIAASYDLPGHRLMWQAVTSYSFVYPAGSFLQLHQLMVHALRRRLGQSVQRELHRLLCGLWEDRAGAATTAADAAAALREAAYHALWSGDLPAAGLLRYADRILARGVRAEVDGLAGDIQRYLAERPVETGGRAEPEDGGSSELDQLVRLLDAETALQRGNATLASAAVDQPPTSYNDDIDARLALAAAQADRILGRTAGALATFEAVWRGTTGACAITAGLWAADLRMCQGRTADAVALAAELSAAAPPDDHEAHGDIARLLALTHRFAFNFPTAARHLADARRHYARAGSTVGLANVATNDTEILAYAAPAEAVHAADRALDAQQNLGAVHELGKVCTALAVARLNLGDPAGALAALDEACEHLDAVGYRSGRARAELARAVAYARSGRFADAEVSTGWAVAELEAAEVYPTLVLLAGYLLDWIDRPVLEVTAAVSRARASLSADPDGGAGPDGAGPDGGAGPDSGLDERIVAALAGMLGEPTVPGAVLYRLARARTDGASGFYNRNVPVRVSSGGRVLVRIPIGGADAMDLRIWPEAEVLRAVWPRVAAAPRLISAGDRPGYQVHEYIEGDLLDQVAPRGRPVPERVIGDVCRFFADLREVPRDALPPLPPDWPEDGDSPGFARRLIDVTRGVYREQAREFGRLHATLKIPADPVEAVAGDLDRLRSRPFRLVHADVHRKNIILSTAGCRFIDWELALYGDPVYDLAAHLHKMGYPPAERDAVLAGWERVLGDRYPGWRDDLDVYLRHEAVKSAVVDSCRYARLATAGVPGQVEALSVKLADKLRNAYPIWGLRGEVSAARVATAFRDWAAG